MSLSEAGGGDETGEALREVPTPEGEEEKRDEALRGAPTPDEKETENKAPRRAPGPEATDTKDKAPRGAPAPDEKGAKSRKTMKRRRMSMVAQSTLRQSIENLIVGSALVRQSNRGREVRCWRVVREKIGEEKRLK